MMSKRTERRVYLAGMKRRALKIYPNDPKAKLANHLANCSCWGCSWNRKWHGPSIQERKNERWSME